MSSYGEMITRYRRLEILRFLAQSPGYTSNGAILLDVLIGMGIASTRSLVKTELSWLKEQELVQCNPAAEFIVVTATARGLEVARGLAMHPEIQQPGPEA